MENETDSTKVENHMKEQATNELRIKIEMLEERERCEETNAGVWSGKYEEQLEGNDELEEGELVEETESETTSQFTTVEGTSAEVEGTFCEMESVLCKLESQEDAARNTAKEDEFGEVSNFFNNEAPEIIQEEGIKIYVAGEAIAFNGEPQVKGTLYIEGTLSEMESVICKLENGEDAARSTVNEDGFGEVSNFWIKEASEIKQEEGLLVSVSGEKMTFNNGPQVESTLLEVEGIGDQIKGASEMMPEGVTVSVPGEKMTFNNGPQVESTLLEVEGTVGQIKGALEMMPEGVTVSVPGEELILTDGQHQELKAFKAHRWLDENFNGSDSDSDVESSHELKIEFGGDSSSEAEQPQVTAVKQMNQKKQNLKTRGEIDLEDLPPIEKLQITVGDDVKLVEVGAVLHNVGVLVVVESKPNLPPLDAETVLFTEGKKVLGKIFDTIGRVIRPCYTVRFNSVAEIEEQGIQDGMSVFYAPLSEDWTHYVFMAHVMKLRGSDASWEHDNEPPPQFIEYSDDEAEKQAKAKQRGKPVEDSTAAGNESRGKRRKKNANQQSRGGFDNAMIANRGQTNTAQSGEDRTNQLSSTEWSSNQTLTSWPPNQRACRPRGPVMHGHRWAQPPAQRAATVQFSAMPPPVIPFPDLRQPPPLSLPAHQPSTFGPPPSHVHGAPPPPGPLFQTRPPSFSQGAPSLPWQSFQNAAPYSFTSPPPAPQPPPFFSPQLSPAQSGLFHLPYGSAPPQPPASFPQPSFGPPAFFRYHGPSRH